MSVNGHASSIGRIAAAVVFLSLPASIAAQDKFFESNGVRIHYVDQGAGEPIVLIHPYAANLEAWIGAGVFPNLAKDHRVVALDLRGHGKSGKPNDPMAYGQELGRDVVRLMDHLGIPRVHIVGYSMGATITAKLLVTNPERFLSATLGAYSAVASWTAKDQQLMEALAIELESDTPFRSIFSPRRRPISRRRPKS